MPSISELCCFDGGGCDLPVMIFKMFFLSLVKRLWGVVRKPFHVSDINHQGNSGTVSLFLFVIKCFNFFVFLP